MDENYRSFIAQLLQDPRATKMFGMNYIPTEDQSLRDASNNLDFGKMNALKRLLGIGEITPNTRVSEDFGALQAQRRF